MRILVFGAGGIGSLFGGMLSKKYDVTLLGRKKYMDEMKKNGLRITGKTKGIFYPKTETKISGKYDLIILTVKAYDTKKSMEILKPVIDSNTIILSLQNGLDNEKIIAKSLKNKGSREDFSKGFDGNAKRFLETYGFAEQIRSCDGIPAGIPSISGKTEGFSIRCDGKSQRDFPSILGKADGLSKGNIGVLRGITGHGVVFVKSGEIYHSGIGETVIGEIDGMLTGRIKKIRSMFNDAGIKTRISSNIKKDVWKKTIMNSAINPITALTGLKNGYLLKIPALTNLMEQVCIEGVNVANASGIFFDSDVFEETKKIASLTSENRSSMLQDIENRKKTEIDFINGAIAKIGKRHGTETPMNSMLTVFVKGIEKRLSAD